MTITPMDSNLRHVLDGPCEDPDCEIHNIGLGLHEETVSQTNLAFYIAGAHAMEMATRRHFRAMGVIEDPIKRLLNATLEGGRPIQGLADRYAR